MIIVQNQYISDDIAERKFVCDLQKCKGACCLEGDLGAPLEEKELDEVDANFHHIKDLLDRTHLETLEEQGLYVLDDEGDWSTPLMENGACAYLMIAPDGMMKCAWEASYLEGKSTFYKPISCHLYPIRITKYAQFDAVNYDQWDICKAACTLGEKLSVPVYQFLKAPLIRKYGEDWYKELQEVIEEREKT